MNHKNVLVRAWELLWQYRALWIFGMILALTSGANYNQSNFQFNSHDFNDPAQTFNFRSEEEFGTWLREQKQAAVEEFGRLRRGEGLSQWEQTLFNLATTIVCVILVLALVGKVFNYVSETALIKMVNAVEEHDQKYTVRQGFALGWSKESWRLFLIDLVIFVPAFVIMLFGLALAAWPFFTNVSGSKERTIIALVSSIGLFFLVIFLGVVVAAVIRLLKQFMRRAVVLDGAGVLEAIRDGSRFAWQHVKDIGIMWLLVFGINIAWAVVLFPVVALLFAISAAGGGLMALVTYTLSSGSVPLVTILGGGLFLLLMAIPMVILGGLMAAYLSSAWTLTYRELQALDALDREQLDPGEGLADPA
ncbi:MAG: hypothetical protein OEZ02_03725 [Anaerolineae bacterium]|nr:hypothetical protein [Anaerolineae bacterium]